MRRAGSQPSGRRLQNVELSVPASSGIGSLYYPFFAFSGSFRQYYSSMTGDDNVLSTVVRTITSLTWICSNFSTSKLGGVSIGCWYVQSSESTSLDLTSDYTGSLSTVRKYLRSHLTLLMLRPELIWGSSELSIKVWRRTFGPLCHCMAARWPVQSIWRSFGRFTAHRYCSCAVCEWFHFVSRS